jgi:8-oxo-dGTP diphosphatase
METKVEVHENRPEGFVPSVEVSFCFVAIEDKLLFLKRGPNQPEGDTWCIPGGKIEAQETPLEAAVRELFEETHIALDPSSLQKLGQLYVQKSHVSYVCHPFGVILKTCPKKVCISPESTDFRWVVPNETESMRLISGSKETLRVYYRWRSQ